MLTYTDVTALKPGDPLYLIDRDKARQLVRTTKQSPLNQLYEICDEGGSVLFRRFRRGLSFSLPDGTTYKQQLAVFVLPSKGKRRATLGWWPPHIFTLTPLNSTDTVTPVTVVDLGTCVCSINQITLGECVCGYAERRKQHRTFGLFGE